MYVFGIRVRRVI